MANAPTADLAFAYYEAMGAAAFDKAGYTDRTGDARQRFAHQYALIAAPYSMVRGRMGRVREWPA